MGCSAVVTGFKGRLGGFKTDMTKMRGQARQSFLLAFRKSLVQKLNRIAHPPLDTNATSNATSNASGHGRRASDVFERRTGGLGNNQTGGAAPAPPPPAVPTPLVTPEEITDCQIETLTGPTVLELNGLDKSRDFEVVFEVQSATPGQDMRAVEGNFIEAVESGAIAEGGLPGSNEVPPVDPPIDLFMYKVYAGALLLGLIVGCGLKCYFSTKLVACIKRRCFDERKPKSEEEEEEAGLDKEKANEMHMAAVENEEVPLSPSSSEDVTIEMNTLLVSETSKEETTSKQNRPLKAAMMTPPQPLAEATLDEAPEDKGPVDNDAGAPEELADMTLAGIEAQDIALRIEHTKKRYTEDVELARQKTEEEAELREQILEMEQRMTSMLVYIKSKIPGGNPEGLKKKKQT